MPPKGWKNDPRWCMWHDMKMHRYWQRVLERQRMATMQQEIEARALMDAATPQLVGRSH